MRGEPPRREWNDRPAPPQPRRANPTVPTGWGWSVSAREAFAYRIGTLCMVVLFFIVSIVAMIVDPENFRWYLLAAVVQAIIIGFTTVALLRRGFPREKLP